ELVEHASSLGHYTIELTPAKPTTGMVVDHLGYPVADAELFMQLRIQKGHGSHSYGGNGELVAKTDEAGKFVLDQIPSDGKIFVLVKTPAGERVVAKPIGAGEKDLLIEIPHQRTLKGIIRGDLSLLGERYFVGAKPHTKRPYVKIDQRYQHEIEQNHHHGEMVYDYIEVIPGDGQGEFEFKGIFQDEVEIKLGPYQAKLNLQEYSYDDVIVLEYNVETAEQKISSRPAETSQSVPEPAGTSE
ncbi:MAG: hypothetical protein KDA78_13580, partial [Planctomycetaceae bacterium]|nr:hypothetical protein [Planctomycetaceae bacterium]